MLGRLRASFAAKLLVAGLLFSLLVIGGISAYLLISRDQQTRVGALSNADNRALVVRGVLQSFTGAPSMSAAQNLAGQPVLAAALAGSSPAATVSKLLAGSPAVLVSDEILVVSDSSGRTLYARSAPDLGFFSLVPGDGGSAIVAALGGGRCSVDNKPGACGIELLRNDQPAYTVAVPVISAGTVVGAVGYIAPLQYQLNRFSTLFQFQTAFIPARDPHREIRNHSGTLSLAATPPELAGGVTPKSDLVHATYTAPDPSSGAPEQVAGSFAAVAGPDGHTLAGYVGVEVPLAAFVGDAVTDEVTLGVITIFVLLVTALLVFLFVEMFVRRPIRRLDRGVARIAGGDYTTAVEVRSLDELGRLAGSVNQMRDKIGGYISEIESARARLDSAVEQVSGVSRALTTTTGGVEALQEEVVRTAAAIAGDGATALIAVRDGDALTVRATTAPDGGEPELERWDAPAALLEGHVVRQQRPGFASLLAVPMFYQDSVVGALAVMRSDGAVVAENEERVLVVLANNAAIAMENTRLFEQERETVRRLRELDAMKTDFLSTVQHELRTPLTAILGLSDLIEMCWDMWEDTPKLEAVRDIQVAAKNLYDIVETIIDFAAVDGESLGLNPSAVSVPDAIREAVKAVGERYKGGLPIPVEVDVDPTASVYADPERFEQVMRALIDNAVKFSDGRGTVTVSAKPQPSRNEVVVTVRDEGIGISDDDLPRIFDRFYQVDNTATRRYGGTGMGLALVRRLVQGHGAKVSVETGLGEGTTVVLLWPAVAASAAGEARAVAEARGDAPSSGKKGGSARRPVTVQ